MASQYCKTTCLVFAFALATGCVATAQSNGSRSLIAATESADWPTVAERIPSGDEVTARQPDGMTALHWAVFHDHLPTVERLIQAGADVNAATRYQVTPLSMACELGYAGVSKRLLAAGASTQSKRMGRESPLMLAARQGNLDVVKALLQAGAAVDVRERNQQTALMWAAASGHTDVVAELVAAGAERDYPLKSGFTALLFAVRNGKSATALRLIDLGCDVNATMQPKRTGGRHPRKGLSALLLAIENGHFELAMELIARGADPNDQRSGFAPLHALTWVRKTKRGEDPDGDPPPRGSGGLNSLEFARALVAAGADVNLQLKKGKSPGKAKLNSRSATPFLYAARTADLALMELLLELGADPTLTNADDCNALMAAAGVGVVAVGEEPGTEPEVCAAIRRLVGLGLDVNHVDKNGETAMHGAAYRCFPEAIAVLASLGADPLIWNTKNKHGWTPHAIASGKRPGSVKPSPATTRALDAAMP